MNDFGFESGPSSVTINNPQVGLFAQTTNSIPVTNSTLETTIIDGGIGTLTVPANTFVIGASFICALGGVISAKNNDQIEIKLKSGAAILGGTGMVTLPGITNKYWDLQVHFTIRQIGGAGVAAILTSGQFTYSKNASNAFEGSDFSLINNTTFNTTIANTLDITAKWSNADPLNNIYSENFVLYRVF